MGKKYGVPNVPQVLTVPNVPNVPLFLIRQKSSLVRSLITSDRSAMLRAIAALSAFTALACAACTVRPLISSGDSVVSLGGSIFTKSAGETASYSGPLGTLSYNDTGKDETVIPGKIANYYGVKAVAEAATSMFRTSESTTRILAKEETSRAATTTAADVEKLKILNPVEEAVPVNP
jgi:hypothetical protein